MHLHGVLARKKRTAMSTGTDPITFSVHTKPLWLAPPRDMINDQEQDELEPAPERSSFPNGASGTARYEAKKQARKDKKKEIKRTVMKWYRECYSGLRTNQEIQEQLFGDDATQKREAWECEEVMTNMYRKNSTLGVVSKYLASKI